MLIGMLIFLGFIVYLIVGRTIVKILENYELVEVIFDDTITRGVYSLFFPLVVIYIIIRETSEYLVDLIIK